MKFVLPEFNRPSFNCPYCRAFAHQNWYAGGARPYVIRSDSSSELWKAMQASQPSPPVLHGTNANQACISVSGVSFSRCESCEKLAVWVNSNLVHPQNGGAVPANPDMPDEIRMDYEEASAILDRSPRGATALIRLAIQKLCKVLGQPGKDLNTDIASLVKGGIDERTQKAMDAVRLIGNSAVHPGQIDLADNRQTAQVLFKLLNLIVDKTISEAKLVDDIYALLPEEKVKAIEKRDGK